MRARLILFLMMVAVCLTASAQTAVPINGQAISTFGTPAAFAQVRVCSSTSTGTPCSATTPIYADYALSVPLANPLTTDSYGNYTFFVPVLSLPNLYTVQVTASPGITYSYVYAGPANGAAYLAQAVLLNPAGNAQQAVSGPLSLGAYGLSAGAITGASESIAGALAAGSVTSGGNITSATGNISATAGNLSAGGNATIAGTMASANAQISAVLTAATANGVVNPVALNPTLGDLGAQINAAFQSQCVAPANGIPMCAIQVPPGVYTVTTGIQYPGSAASRQNVALILDGATLNFSGAGITYGIFTGIGHDHILLHGGVLHFTAAPNTKAGIFLGYGAQGCYIEDVRESGVTGGDGIADFGCNVVTIIDSTFQTNLIGIHLLGSPGYASNNVKVLASISAGNTREGIVDGDISQYPVGWPLGNGGSWNTVGSSSPNFNNLFMGNDLEGNGSSSNRGSENTVYPAILLALTNGDGISNNYFEATPYEQVKLGCLGYADAVYQGLYGVATGPNCGTAQGPSIINNYSTTNGGWDYFLNYSTRATVTGNSDQLAATNSCFVNANVGLMSYINNNNYLATSEFCVGGAAVSPDYWSQLSGPNIIETAGATQGSAYYFNAGPGVSYTAQQQFIRMTLGGPPTPNNPNQNTTSNPNCDPAYARGTIWIDTCTSGATGCVTGGGVAWICKDDTVLPTPIADGHATWVKAF